MEILNRGSFVPLENRERIDQLIYTAREMATEMSRDEGFQNKSQTNHQLGLEVWTGSEYVCRAHEEANIRNLFLSKFLERLREIEKENNVQVKTVAPTTTPIVTEPVQHPTSVPVSVQPPVERTVPEQPPQSTGQDEYLGLLPTSDQPDTHISSFADECTPGYDPDIEAIVDRLDNEKPERETGRLSEPTSIESAPPQTADTVNAPVKATAHDHPPVVEPNVPGDAATETGQTEEVQNDAAETIAPESIESIVIAEKEPYNFDSCTVTAVVQLLPQAEGVRKCVVSVRTHDFTPHITIVDVSAANVLDQLSGTLGLAFEQYRNELPAMAADKMKKEKPAAKKQTKSGSKAKSATAQTKAVTKTETSAASPTPDAESDQSQQGLFAS